METRTLHEVIDDPIMVHVNGLEVTYNEVTALYPSGEKPIYCAGYEPTGKEIPSMLALGEVASKRFIDYYRYFNQHENIGAGDAFSLVAHLSSEQALETLRGPRLTYQSRGEATLVSSCDLAPGGFYFTGIAVGDRATSINHWMVGVGHDSVMARWGQRFGSRVMIGKASVATEIYGGQLFRLHGQLYRSDV